LAQAEKGRKGARNRAQCGPRPGDAGESTESVSETEGRSVQFKCTRRQGDWRGKRSERQAGPECPGSGACPRESGSRASASRGQALMGAGKTPFSSGPWSQSVSMVDGLVGPRVHHQVSPSHILHENFMLEIFLAKHTTAEHECSAFSNDIGTSRPTASLQLTPRQEPKGWMMVHPHLPGRTSEAQIKIVS